VRKEADLVAQRKSTIAELLAVGTAGDSMITIELANDLENIP